MKTIFRRLKNQSGSTMLLVVFGLGLAGLALVYVTDLSRSTNELTQRTRTQDKRQVLKDAIRLVVKSQAACVAANASASTFVPPNGTDPGVADFALRIPGDDHTPVQLVAENQTLSAFGLRVVNKGLQFKVSPSATPVPEGGLDYWQGELSLTVEDPDATSGMSSLKPVEVTNSFRVGVNAAGSIVNCAHVVENPCKDEYRSIRKGLYVDSGSTPAQCTSIVEILQAQCGVDQIPVARAPASGQPPFECKTFPQFVGMACPAGHIPYSTGLDKVECKTPEQVRAAGGGCPPITHQLMKTPTGHACVKTSEIYSCSAATEYLSGGGTHRCQFNLPKTDTGGSQTVVHSGGIGSCRNAAGRVDEYVCGDMTASCEMGEWKVTAQECRWYSPPPPPPPIPVGSYQASCTGCTSDGTTVNCSCTRVDGVAVTTSLNYSSCSQEIANFNGVLTCGMPSLTQCLFWSPPSGANPGRWLVGHGDGWLNANPACHYATQPPDPQPPGPCSYIANATMQDNPPCAAGASGPTP